MYQARFQWLLLARISMLGLLLVSLAGVGVWRLQRDHLISSPETTDSHIPPTSSQSPILLYEIIVVTQTPAVRLLTPQPSLTFTTQHSSSPIDPVALAPHTECLLHNTDRTQAKVIKVIDGDTIKVEMRNIHFNVRYIGIDAPEIYPLIEFMAEQAKSANERLVEGQIVTLVKNTSQADKYGNLLRYVIVGSTFVNYELLQRGYARAVAYPPDTACQISFQEAEAYAMASQIGLWAITPTPSMSATPPTTSASCHPAYPDVCIPPPPPDLDCKDITYRRFRVLPPDPHHFDGNKDGIGCEK